MWELSGSKPFQPTHINNMETYIGVSIDSWITLTSLTTMFSIHNHKSMFVYKLLLAS